MISLRNKVLLKTYATDKKHWRLALYPEKLISPTGRKFTKNSLWSVEFFTRGNTILHRKCLCVLYKFSVCLSTDLPSLGTTSTAWYMDFSVPKSHYYYIFLPQAPLPLRPVGGPAPPVPGDVPGGPHHAPHRPVRARPQDGVPRRAGDGG